MSKVVCSAESGRPIEEPSHGRSKKEPGEREQELPQSWKGLGFFVGVLLAFGLFFRVAYLDKKVYQHDEVMTSLRVAGFQVGDVRQQIVARHEIDIQSLQQYQRVSSERGVFATLLSLATDDPKHPPLYYILARIWVQAFGDSTVALRSLSVLLSLFALVCLYWLCQELFESSRVAWMAVALVAISPFHVLYAQEARQYSLWTLTIALSSAALLRALRRQTWRSWSVYAAAVILGLYAHILFVLVSFAHGIYVIQTNRRVTSMENCFLSKEATKYVKATLIAFLVFAPWVIVIALQLPILHETTRWITKEVESLYVWKRWMLGASALFFDPSGGVIFSARSGAEKPLTYWVRLPILLVIGYSFLFLWRTTPQRVWFFIIALVGATIAPLLLTDAVTGWRTSTPFRYLTPGYVGMQLSVAYLLTSETASPNVYWRKSWQLAAAVLAASAIVSCVRSAQAEVWWNKEASYSLPQVARIINQKNRPLLLSTLEGKNLGNSIALSYLLEARVRFRALSDPAMLPSLDSFTDAFILNPSDQLLRQLEEKGYQIRSVIKSGELRRLTKKLAETSKPTAAMRTKS